MPWLTPYTIDAIKQLAERGVRKLTVASPSFAVDCLETLEEVALEYRDKFTQWGGEQLTLVPCLNDDDAHARALANIVTSHLARGALAVLDSTVMRTSGSILVTFPGFSRLPGSLALLLLRR